MWRDKTVLFMAGLMGVGLLIGSMYVVLRPTDVHADAERGRQGWAAESVERTEYNRRNSRTLSQPPTNTPVQGGARGYRQGEPAIAPERGLRQGDQGAGEAGLHEDHDWMTVEGTVLSLQISDGADLVVRTAGGEEILVGGGPGFYWTENGYQLSSGASVRVSGYHEDGEFKAAEIENLSTGETIVLRDADGRPMWAGRGQGKNRRA
jgi:hypothetical protein